MPTVTVVVQLMSSCLNCYSEFEAITHSDMRQSVIYLRSCIDQMQILGVSSVLQMPTALFMQQVGLHTTDVTGVRL